MTDSHKKWIVKNIFDYTIIKKMWSMLPPARKRGAIRLWLMMLFGMILEMVGAGLVIPVIALLTQENIASHSPKIQRLLEKFGNPNQQTLVISIMLILVAVYLLKNIYLAFLAWKQSKFVFELQFELSNKLFAIYLRQPYTFHLQRNSAHLIRNVQGEIALLINSTINPCMLILAEGLVVLGLFGLLVFVEPLGTFAVFGVLLLAGGLFQRYTKHHTAHWGLQRQWHEGARIKQLHQGLDGVKDVKLLGRESDFLNQYAEHTRQSMKMSRRQYAMQQMPRLWLELLAITGLAILMILMIAQDKPMTNVLPTLALFAAISFRLMPSANRIISGMQQMRFGLPAVNLLHKELAFEVPEVVQNPSAATKIIENHLEVENVSYVYPKTEKAALDSISLKVNKGALIGFIGESGSGKSTLIDLILGLITPTHGRVLIDGVDISDNLRAWQNQIGYVPQSIYLTDDTLRRNVAFGLAEEDIDDQAVERAITAAQLNKFVDDLPKGIHTIVGERGVRLSGGQRQRIGIARALYHDPAVLVLDEATSALDMETESDVMDAVISLQGKKTILMVAHRLSTVKRCDRIFKLAHGKVLAVGSPDEILYKK